MFDIVAFGELLIDFIPAGISISGNEVFEKNPGGAPANVLAAVRRLGKSAAFMGMVGKDQFGNFLDEVLRSCGIDTTGLIFSKSVNTTLAFVHLDERGDRSFSFYRNPGADMMFEEKDINYELIRNSSIFHFGSVSMTSEPARSATLAAVKYAKDNGLLISYDPNLRPPLWSSMEEAKENMILGLEYADIVKISIDELKFITGTSNLEKSSDILCKAGIDTVLITLGPDGCFYSYQGGRGKVNTYDTKVVDTTGAGDAFLGGVLYKLCGYKKSEIRLMGKAEFESIIDFANAAGALTAAKRGAIPAMPTLGEICECQINVQKFR